MEMPPKPQEKENERQEMARKKQRENAAHCLPAPEMLGENLEEEKQMETEEPRNCHKQHQTSVGKEVEQLVDSAKPAQID